MIFYEILSKKAGFFLFYRIMKYLIAGLGNIGPEYELSRHNIGFLVADRLADLRKVNFEPARLASKTEFKFKGRQFHLIKPVTYMNQSGKAVRYWLETLKIPVSNLLVVVDDIALPFGTLRMRARGSDAGHNGMKNIEKILGSDIYPRLRFGIGDEFPKGSQVDYVLSRFTEEEFEKLPAIIDRACEMIISFGINGIDRTMSQYNKNPGSDARDL